ncbi:MAG: SUMF1/EgtB/PvdO family nonheme iron enzyme, partial [Deltaproteobacteria bacterium]|nr:SUMF1/EgtB/PvdO family nonheme iron enzyme [Deltaproteobacteria bacterium]
MSSFTKTLGYALVLTLGTWVAACDECETSRDCDTGEACIDGTCESAPPWNPSTDSDTDVDSDSDVDTDSDADTDDPYPLEWIEIPGGTFAMGSNEGPTEEQPVHEVTVPTFEMTRTEIITGQYAKCVADGS